MKNYELMIKHPCIHSLLASIKKYPIYFILYSIYANLLPMYHNTIHNSCELSLASDWIPKIAAIAAGPWLIITIIFMIYARNPYNKIGTIIRRFSFIIITVLLYAPVALLMDAIYGEFFLSSHLALITAIAITYLALIGYGKIRSIYRHHKYMKMYCPD